MLESVKKLFRKLTKKSDPTWIGTFSDSDSSTTSIPVSTTGYIYIPTDSTTGTTINSFANVAYNQPVEVSVKIGEDKRIEKKPIEVVEEVLIETPLINIDPKLIKKDIKTIEKRISVLKDHVRGTFSDENAALMYLNNRLYFKKYAPMFSWKTTNEEKLKALCSKYKIKRVNPSSFYKNIPIEAVEEIDKFVTACRKINKKFKPEFELIVDDGGVEDKRDPILLARSPFGRWWYVLGAWDKEVMYLDKILLKDEK